MGAKVLFLYISLFMPGFGPSPILSFYEETVAAPGDMRVCDEQAVQLEAALKGGLVDPGFFSGVSVICASVDRERAIAIHREMEIDAQSMAFAGEKVEQFMKEHGEFAESVPEK